MTNSVIGIIPARGGSKGVVGKNKRLVGGRPLITYSIEVALASKCIDRVIVTSDDEEILSIAGEYDVDLVRRPSPISSDTSPVFDAVAHAFSQLKIDEFQALIVLQPTSPLRTAHDVDEAFAKFTRLNRPVCSVYRVDDAHPARMYEGDGEMLRPLFPELASVRRQDLPPIYHRNGALYIVGPAQFACGEIISNNMAGYEMPADRSVNLDSPMDLVLLEHLLSA